MKKPSRASPESRKNSGQAAKDPFEKEALAYDATVLFSQGLSVSTISTRLKVSRKRVVSLIQSAFTSGMADVSTPASPAKAQERLGQLYPRVAFKVIAAEHEFYRLAGLHLLDVLAKTHKAITPAIRAQLANPSARSAETGARMNVLVGGGATMKGIADELSEVLREPVYRDLDRPEPQHLRFVNATAGGVFENPDHEASFVAYALATTTQQEFRLWGLSSDPPPLETQALTQAIQNSLVVVSGIGVDRSAYFVKAIEDKNVPPPEEDKPMVGEFLYHPFGKDGKSHWEISPAGRRIIIKEDSLNGTSAAESPSAPSICSTLGTLLHLKGIRANPHLKGPDALPVQRRVVCITKCSNDNRQAKANALLAILNQELGEDVLSDVIISAPLASTLITSRTTAQSSR